MDQPSTWISRTLEAILGDAAGPLRLFPIVLLTGPRQTGKSSLLLRLGENRQYVALDDLDVRLRATSNPSLFLKDLTLPVTIDEIQYAPQLLPGLKRIVDEGAPPASIWLTGSQNFEVMQGVRESLAGRVAILTLLGLSDEEKAGAALTPTTYFEGILETGFPKLRGVTDSAARQLYLNSYSNTYIERDIRELVGIQKRREFEVFVRLCALRTGQLLNVQELGRDAGVSSATAKEWLGVLEDSYLIRLIPPFFANRTKRLVKTPKLYFLDAGLAAHLAGWRDAAMLGFGPMNGAVLETHILGQILRWYRHRAREAEVSFWRTRDGQEIDFLVDNGAAVRPVEVKLGDVRPADLPGLERIAEDRWTEGLVVSLAAIGSAGEPLAAPGWRVCAPERLPLALGLRTHAGSDAAR